MGKSYTTEIDQLAATYSWAMQVQVAALTGAVCASLPFPLLALGSGGSLTTAHLVASLHQRYAGHIAKAVTPLELVRDMPDRVKIAVLLLSAEGKNSDVIGAFEHTVAREPSHLAVLCMRTTSPLAALARPYRYVATIDFDLPAGKDGFLATNSLLASSVVLCRAYVEALSVANPLPGSLGDLISALEGEGQELTIDVLRRSCLPLWRRDTILVLHSPTTHAAAIDLESKFMEAALGNLHIADYRNFGHGRHYWLAKRGATTAVLALVADEDRSMADRTLRLIPPDVPVVRLPVPGQGVRASLAALVLALHIVGFAGEAQGVDPGRPSVPAFGRRLYGLKALTTRRDTRGSMGIERTAIERKTGFTIDALEARGDLAVWRQAYAAFTHKLGHAAFGGVIFDYDGTLCDRANRYSGPDDAVLSHMCRVLEAGVIVGIATGRGKSAKEVFRRALAEDLWSRVVIGYYNGADMGMLDDDDHPDADTLPCPALQPIARRVEADPCLRDFAACTYRRWQITIEPTKRGCETLIWEIAQHIAQTAGQPGVRVLQSSHSIDILAPGISKRSVIKAVKAMTLMRELELPILCIGDRGHWPGNDVDLLSEPHSLSVDDTSPDPHMCWNLAPAGYRGVQATLAYLAAMHVSEAGLRIAVREIARGGA